MQTDKIVRLPATPREHHPVSSEGGYVELSTMTNYCFLEAASHAGELAVTAAALGMTALGIADRNSLSGIVRAHVACKEAGIRLVVGCRLSFRDAPDILAYPIDRAAYGRLCELLTLGRRRAPKGACHLDYQDFVAAKEGILAIVVPHLPPSPSKWKVREGRRHALPLPAFLVRFRADFGDAGACPRRPATTGR